MAGDWIKMRMDLPEDPAVYKLASITKMDRLSVIGRLYAFWAWADKYAVDGRVDGATSLLVDDVARHDGFADALVAVKWLEIGDDFISLPHHERHNGESAKERGLKNARQARWREGKDKTSSTPVDATPSTPASTREEKRREEETPVASLPGFDRFWTAWPKSTRKEARGKCLDAWRKAKAEGRADLIIAHVESKKLTTDWAKESGRFIEAPLVYLNQRRWEGAESEDTASADRIGSFI